MDLHLTISLPDLSFSFIENGRAACLLFETLFAGLFAAFFLSRAADGFRKSFLLLSLFLQGIYLFWRAADTLPVQDGVLSLFFGLLLFAAEALRTGHDAVCHLLFWEPYRPPEMRSFPAAPLPTVDIFIPTYDESAALLRKTIVACQNLDYPKEKLTVYLCDDGGRESVRRLCGRLSVRYLARGEHGDAKAGNLNFGLSHGKGELFALFDADMVPKPNFLRETVGYFADAKTGFVQTPQVFYNPDAFQYNLKQNDRIPNEQDFFMREVQEGRARFNAVLHVGTNAVLRRKAVDEIGGIPRGCITEDMATGMLLQAHGYRGVFVNKELTAGLAAGTFGDLLRQRERWCRGNIQVARRWNPLTLPGLTFCQRLLYLDGLLYWFFGVQKLIYLLSPIFFLLFGLATVHAGLFPFLLFWAPAYLGSLLSYDLLTSGNRSRGLSHLYETAMAPYLAAVSLLESLGVRMSRFRVTPKETSTRHVSFTLWAAWPQIALLLITAAGWIKMAIRLRYGAPCGEEAAALFLNFFWSLYDFGAILFSVALCFERPRFRKTERITVDAAVCIRCRSLSEPIWGRMRDLSESGMRIVCPDAAFFRKEAVRVGLAGVGGISANVVRLDRQGGQVEYGVRFAALSPKRYARLVRYLTEQMRSYCPACGRAEKKERSLEKRERSEAGYRFAGSRLFSKRANSGFPRIF